MQKFGKLIALVGAAALLVVATVFGTMAYLQDTDTNTNTFTIGKVGISMTETNVDGKDASGNANAGEARDVANEYHVVPGETYTKDPTIVVDANSEEAYVYMTIDLNGYDNLVDKLPIGNFATFYKDGKFDLNTFCNTDTTDWIDCGTVYDMVNGTMQYRFRYATTVDTDATDETLTPLFTEFTIPDNGVTNENIDAFSGLELVAKAYAIQSSGFNDYDQAWRNGFGNGVDNFNKNK